MPPEPLRLSALGIDLSPRFVFTNTVTGSPALAAETIVATLPALSANVTVATGVYIAGNVAYTVGTSGTAVTFRIRQTGLAGTVIYNTGAMTRTAAALASDYLQGVDTAAVLPGQVYVVTMQVTAGAAVSTVSAVNLIAYAI